MEAEPERVGSLPVSTMQQGERINLEPSANFQKMFRSAAAEMLNVGARTAASAATVRNEGTAGTVIETVTATKD